MNSQSETFYRMLTNRPKRKFPLSTSTARCMWYSRRKCLVKRGQFKLPVRLVWVVHASLEVLHIERLINYHYADCVRKLSAASIGFFLIALKIEEQ